MLASHGNKLDDSLASHGNFNQWHNMTASLTLAHMRGDAHPHSLNRPCRFHIIGGECNYLLRFSPVTKRLEFVPDQEWMTPCMQQWRQQDIQYVLREAEKLLMDTAYRLRLPVKVHYTPTVCTCRESTTYSSWTLLIDYACLSRYTTPPLCILAENRPHTGCCV